MKIIVRIIQIVAGLAVLAVLGAYLLPGTVTVVRSVVIPASATEIFPYVNSLQRTEEWSPWLALDPDVGLVYSGPEQGVGNRLEWTSDHESVGSGSQEITLSVENERVETALDFGSMGTAEAYFDLSETDGRTEVTWGLVSHLGYNPIARYMGLMLDSWVGADYERGLANLNSVVTRE
ncbi:MAG: SRPBCC family protein [Paracoccaceae bacterium]|nr:SRPBCC family protein [Paracoccaceae bacterium]